MGLLLTPNVFVFTAFLLPSHISHVDMRHKGRGCYSTNVLLGISLQLYFLMLIKPDLSAGFNHDHIQQLLFYCYNLN